LIKTFFLERSNKVQQILRRYTNSGGECPHRENGGYHNALVVLGNVDVPVMPEDAYDPLETCTAIVDNNGKVGGLFDFNDPRWPKKCICGYTFDSNVDKHYWPQRLYQRTDTGELMTLRDAPVGAMWHVDYAGMHGPDGKCLVVRIPTNHNWMVDSRASNCDSPCKWCGMAYHSHNKERCSNPGNPQYPYTAGAYEDSRPDHRCWVRHGYVRQQVHVDKNGVTCNAGAGSIVSPNGWHGFLHNGHLTSC
jgi:hypothetical protein